ncbi:MAG TPA: hypothetical protein VF550_18095 [Polyangia bacterium]
MKRALKLILKVLSVLLILLVLAVTAVAFSIFKGKAPMLDEIS